MGMMCFSQSACMTAPGITYTSTGGDAISDTGSYVLYQGASGNWYASDPGDCIPDSDGDGVKDDVDAFPFDPNETVDTDGDGTGDNADTDDDGDGVDDTSDAFPLDGSESVDTDGDGIGNNADTDDDGDGVDDASDPFPLDGTESADTDGDGIGDNADTDDDNDGTPDSADAFPLDDTEDTDTDGDGVGNNADNDDDGDGALDTVDPFPLDSTESVDTDGDGIGDNADTDDDGDGVLDVDDAFQYDPNETTDTDGDGIGNNADTDDDGDGVLDVDDAFQYDPNETTDTDGDGVGNNADTDDDGDGVLDVDDAFQYDPNETTDTDGDGIGNNADTDDDGDTVLDVDDAFQYDPNETTDTDGDGVGNNADTDDDGDTVLDVDDAFPDDPNETIDTDGDGIGNNADTDDDGDGVLDVDDDFPLDSTETSDRDGDGVGDNADDYPDDKDRSEAGYTVKLIAGSGGRLNGGQGQLLIQIGQTATITAEPDPNMQVSSFDSNDTTACNIVYTGTPNEYEIASVNGDCEISFTFIDPNVAAARVTTSSGDTANQVAPNIYILIDDTKWMNSEVLYGDGTSKTDLDLTNNTMLVNYKDPAYTDNTGKVGAGNLEKCHLYNRLAFNNSFDYDPWDAIDANNANSDFANRDYDASCDSAPSEGTCAKYYPDGSGSLSGNNCDSLDATSDHCILKYCEDDGCEKFVEVDPSATYTDEAISYDDTYSNGQTCGYTARAPVAGGGLLAPAQSKPDYFCKTDDPTNPATKCGCYGVMCSGATFYGAGGLLPGACATVSLSGGNTWTPQEYTCQVAQDIPTVFCGDGTGQYTSDDPLKPNVCRYTGTPAINVVYRNDLGNTACEKRLSDWCPVNSFYAQGGNLPTDTNVNTSAKYAFCGGGAPNPSGRKYPNIVQQRDRIWWNYVPFSEDSTNGTDGEYDSAYSECSTGSPVSAYSINGNTGNNSADNYANWFTYHRTRMHVVKAALLDAIDGLSVGRVTVATVSSGVIVNTGGKRIEMVDISDATGKAAVKAAIRDITPKYTDNNLPQAYLDALNYFADASNENRQYAGYDSPDTINDVTCNCRANHVVVVSGSDWKDDPAIDISTTAENYYQNDFNATFQNNVKAVTFSKTAAKSDQHVISSWFSITRDSTVKEVSTTLPNSGPADPADTTGADADSVKRRANKLVYAAFISGGVYRRVSSYGDVTANAFPNIGKDLGTVMNAFFADISSVDNNADPTSECGVVVTQTPGVTKRLSWKEIKRTE